MESAKLGVKFRPKPFKSKIYCSVFGGSSKACENPELSLHHFPGIRKIKVEHVNKLEEMEWFDYWLFLFIKYLFEYDKKVREQKSKYKSNLTSNEGSIQIFSFTST